MPSRGCTRRPVSTSRCFTETADRTGSIDILVCMYDSATTASRQRRPNRSPRARTMSAGDCAATVSQVVVGPFPGICHVATQAFCLESADHCLIQGLTPWFTPTCRRQSGHVSGCSRKPGYQGGADPANMPVTNWLFLTSAVCLSAVVWIRDHACAVWCLRFVVWS